jgi:pyrroloquinoline quinone biosynthesis protein E
VRQLRVPGSRFRRLRCQAFALTGDEGNTEPACTLSPLDEDIFGIAGTEAAADANRFICRNFSGGTVESEAGAGN